MLALMPRQVPSLATILADLGNPSPVEIARALGVTPRTVERWLHDADAPRPALLALFWLTRWGQSEVDCRAINDAQHQAQRAAVLESEVCRLRAEVSRLVRLGRFDCANDVSHTAPAAPVLQLVRSTAPG
jgi:hypothetical protein